MSDKTILAIETSCDETGLAVVRQTGERVTVLSQAVVSQIDVHALTGGVVPEVAAREHVQVIGSLIKQVLKEAQIAVGKSQLDAIAVTVGPGLMPSLVIGVQTARVLSYLWNIPIVPVHHIAGHIASALYKSKQLPDSQSIAPNEFILTPTTNLYPALALIVSGGHTQLIEIDSSLSYKILGSTLDDAAGEAFDKVARLLGLPYPGGPHLSELAAIGDEKAFPFPRPMLHSGNLNFSFSGLKTAVLYTLRDNSTAHKANIAASFELAVIDVLVAKTKRALLDFVPAQLLLAGGVAANQRLRIALTDLASTYNIPLSIAPLSLCGDNGIMIALAGLVALKQSRTTSWRDINAQARLPLY